MALAAGSYSTGSMGCMCVRPLTDVCSYLHGVELCGLLHVLAAGDAVDEGEELVLDLSSEVGHGTS